MLYDAHCTARAAQERYFMAALTLVMVMVIARLFLSQLQLPCESLPCMTRRG